MERDDPRRPQQPSRPHLALPAPPSTYTSPFDLEFETEPTVHVFRHVRPVSPSRSTSPPRARRRSRQRVRSARSRSRTSSSPPPPPRPRERSPPWQISSPSPRHLSPSRGEDSSHRDVRSGNLNSEFGRDGRDPEPREHRTPEPSRRISPASGIETSRLDEKSRHSHQARVEEEDEDNEFPRRTSRYGRDESRRYFEEPENVDRAEQERMERQKQRDELRRRKEEIMAEEEKRFEEMRRKERDLRDEERKRIAERNRREEKERIIAFERRREYERDQERAEKRRERERRSSTWDSYGSRSHRHRDSSSDIDVEIYENTNLNADPDYYRRHASTPFHYKQKISKDKTRIVTQSNVSYVPGVTPSRSHSPQRHHHIRRESSYAFDPTPVAYEEKISRHRDDPEPTSYRSHPEVYTVDDRTLRLKREAVSTRILQSDDSTLDSFSSSETEVDDDGEVPFDFFPWNQDDSTEGDSSAANISTLNTTGLSTEKGTPGDSYEKSEKLFAHQIFKSQYGLDEMGELHIDLTSGSPPGSTPGSTPGRRRQPRMRWIHIQTSMMNFASFTKHIQDLDGFQDGERLEIANLLSRVKQTDEKPLLSSNGLKGRTMEPDFVQQMVKDEKTGSLQNFTFLCLPFFSQEEYKRLSIPSKSAAHPTKTLLQTRNSSISKNRDMQQAVCRIGTAPDGYCLHVPQLWAVTVHDQMLITYSQQTLAQIMKQTIKSHDISLNDQSLRETFIEVNDGGCRIWRLPMKSCESWFEFLSHFNQLVSSDGEFWAELKYQGKPLKPEAWPQIVERAQRSSVPLTISATLLHSLSATRRRGSDTASMSESDTSDTSGTRVPAFRKFVPGMKRNANEQGNKKFESQKDEHASTAKNPAHSISVESFHSEGSPKHAQQSSDTIMLNLRNFTVFGWLVARSQPSNSMHTASVDDEEIFNGITIPEEAMSDVLSKVYEALQSSMSKTEKKLLEQCGSSTLEKIDSLLKEGQPDKGARKRENIGLPPLLFFLPRGTQSEMIAKYWGALEKLSGVFEKKAPYKQPLFWEAKMLIREMITTMGVINKLLSGGQGPTPWQLRIPSKFIRAWMRYFRAIILLTSDEVLQEESRASRYLSETRRELRRAVELLDLSSRDLTRGLAELLKTYHKTKLPDHELVLPTGILSMIASNLIQEMMPEGSLETSGVYSEYLKRLEDSVGQNPYVRSHSEKLRLFRQETAIIIDVLGKQIKQLRAMRDVGVRGISHSSDYSPNVSRIPREQEYHINTSALSSVIAKLELFRALQARAEELETENLYMIETNKDRQEAAVVIFTIVTIIFLPLSFVSSYLGMNTDDIRNMGYRQWLFWATSIPVTIAIVALALWWADELEDVKGWIGMWFLSRKKGGGGAARAGEELESPLAPAQIRYPETYARHHPSSPPVIISSTMRMNSMPGSRRTRSTYDRVRRHYR